MTTEQERVRMMNSLPEHVGKPYLENPSPDRYPIRMDVTEFQWKLMEEAFELLKKQSEGYILRAQNNPSDTIKSTLTIERHRKKLAQLNGVISRFQENVF